MGLFQRLRNALGLNEEYDEFYYTDDDAAQPSYAQDPYSQSGYVGEDSAPRRKALPSNVIGLPGVMMEVVLMQPRSFEEIPDAVTALRERKAVVLNLNFIDVDQAQRCADYVAGGSFAIDGHQQQIGDNVFLFTPNFVQITQHPHQEPVAPPPPPHPPEQSAFHAYSSSPWETIRSQPPRPQYDQRQEF